LPAVCARNDERLDGTNSFGRRDVVAAEIICTPAKWICAINPAAQRGAHSGGKREHANRRNVFIGLIVPKMGLV